MKFLNLFCWPRKLDFSLFNFFVEGVTSFAVNYQVALSTSISLGNTSTGTAIFNLSCGGPSSWRLPHAMCVAVAPSPIRVLSIDVLLFQGTLVPSDDDWWCWDSFCLLICPPCRQNWWQAEIRLLWVIVSLIDVYLYQRRKLNPYNSIINHIHQTAILELVTTRCRFHKLFCTLHQSFVPYAELLRW